MRMPRASDVEQKRTSPLHFHEVRRHFSYDVALHLHLGQLRAKPADLHLISTHGLAASPAELTFALRVVQLNKVCSTTPSVCAAAAMLRPPSTSLTVSCLNPSVYRALVVFVIYVLVA